MSNLLVDTGFLVALGRRADPLHAAATDFYRRNARPLVTVSPVVIETCFFLNARAKIQLIDLIRGGHLKCFDLPVEEYQAIAVILEKYADRDIDFADAALIWLAEKTGCTSILTVDLKDFAVFRLQGRRRFEVVEW